MAYSKFVSGKFAVRFRDKNNGSIATHWFGPYKTLGIAKRWQKHYAKKFEYHTPFIVIEDEWDKEIA